MRCSSSSGVTESCRTACSRRVVIAAVGVPWVAQLAMRTDSATSETAWIPFPSAEAVTRALLGVSGIAGLGVLLAVARSLDAASSREADLAVWLATWAFGPILLALVISIARPIFLDRYLVIAAPAFAMLAAVAVMGVAGRLRAGVVCRGRCARRRSGSRSGTRRQMTATGVARTGGAPSRRSWSDAAMPTRSSSFRGGLTMRRSTTALAADDVSTADSIWVLHWSEDGADLAGRRRRPLGFGDHVLVEKLQFGWRVSAQLWRRRPGLLRVSPRQLRGSERAFAEP